MSGAVSVHEGAIPFRGYRTWYRIVGDREEPGKLPFLTLHGGPGAGHDYLDGWRHCSHRPAHHLLRSTRLWQLRPPPQPGRSGRWLSTSRRSARCVTRSASTGSICSANRGAACWR